MYLVVVQRAAVVVPTEDAAVNYYPSSLIAVPEGLLAQLRPPRQYLLALFVNVPQVGSQFPSAPNITPRYFISLLTGIIAPLYSTVDGVPALRRSLAAVGTSQNKSTSVSAAFNSSPVSASSASTTDLLILTYLAATYLAKVLRRSCIAVFESSSNGKV